MKTVHIFGGAFSYLSGWRPPKKIYFKLGQAKSGFAHVPDAAKPLLEIAKFTFDSVVEDGKILVDKQREAREKKEESLKVKRAKWASGC